VNDLTKECIDEAIKSMSRRSNQPCVYVTKLDAERFPELKVMDNVIVIDEDKKGE
jgi:hypothetical protein